MFTYKTSGTCSREISFDIVDGKLTNISFVGGCNGNLSGISRLCEGKDAHEVMETLRGTRCGAKNTSCPDQLSRAIEKALEK